MDTQIKKVKVDKECKHKKGISALHKSSLAKNDW